MTNSAIVEELLKQLEQLPIESKKKVLEFAQALNITTPKGKPGKDMLKFAGTLEQDSLKVMEETGEYSFKHDQMSIEDKIRTMEMLWDDLCKQADGFSSPVWHKNVLDEREEQLKNGNDEFVDWDLAKKQIRDKVL